MRLLDPNWKPTPSLHATTEGQIAANLAVVRDANARLIALGQRPIAVMGPPPSVPPVRPTRGSERNSTIRELARWFEAFGDLSPLPTEPVWLYNDVASIIAVLDPPRTLEELQAGAAEPRAGYDVHHIVERAAQVREGFHRSDVYGPQNLARIPRLKHWQLTGWYMTPLRRVGDMSPRDYLVGKPLEEHRELGLDALEAVGVLKQ